MFYDSQRIGIHVVHPGADPLGESQRRTVGRHQIHPFRETAGSHLAATQVAQRLLRRQLAHGRRPAAQQAFSLEDKITSRTPPVFVWHTMEDETVPVENTLLLVSALHRAGVPCEAHLFEKGCHGTSLSTAEVNHPSAHRSRWLTLAREWLDDTFDFHLGTGETGG